MLKKTSALIGAALDYAVARVIALGTDQLRIIGGDVFIKNCDALILCRFSTDWAQGGPIIERERISIKAQQPDWTAYIAICDGMTDRILRGPTPLIAAMRCFVASKLGDEVKIPEHVVQTT